MTDWKQLVESAEGYLDLGMPDEASAELDGMPAECSSKLEMVWLRTEIYKQKKDWPMMRNFAEELVKLCPEECEPWVWFASATRRSRSLVEAQAILLNALKYHDSESTIHFNLACYASLAGNLPLARERLARACLLEPKNHVRALKDRDLEPLRAELGEFKEME